jgi:hypothetical protein
MLGRSHRVWKYGAIIGATVIVPTIYLIVNEGKAESLPFVCWVGIGFAVGWDLARMISGKARGRGKRRSLPRRGLLNEQTNCVGVSNGWLDLDQEASHSIMADLSHGPQLRLHSKLEPTNGYLYFDDPL